MRRYFLIGLYILYMTLPCHAQSYTDSIRSYLQSPKPDTAKVYLLLKLAQLPDSSPDTLISYGQNWYAYALKHKISNGIPEALYTTGLGWLRKGQNTEALDYLYKSAVAWEKNGQNPLQLARTYELIGTVYKMLEKFPDALSYYRLACVIKKAQHNEVILLSTYNSLGNTFRALNRMDSAIWYLKKALPLAAGNPLTKSQVANNLGNIYWSLKNWPQANEWYKAALMEFESLHHAEGIAEANFNLGAVATQLEQYPAAILYYNNSLQAVSNGQSLEHQEWIYEHLADAYFKTGHYEQAYKHAIKYAAIKDSTLSLNIQKSIADLKEKYETEKKEHALALEQARTTKLSLINTNQTRIIYLLAGVAIIISIMGYFMIANMRRKQILAAELADLKEKEKQQLIQEQALRSNIAMLEGQQAERQRIARDLHDRLGSTLTSVRRFITSPDYSGKIDGMLDEAIDDVRRISHDLSDGILQKYGLAEALEDLKDTVAVGGMHIKLHQQDFGILPATIAAEIYYITRELVSNAMKHSKASELSITLMREENLLYLTVEDNGQGFDTTANNRGIGLANIETRAFKINAQFTIESYPGKGTCIFFTIPL